MPFSWNINFDISSIRTAHEFVLNSSLRCEYPHGRGCYGLVCVLDGTAEYRFSDGKRLSVFVGDVLMLFPGAAYSISVKNSFEHCTVNFELHEESSSFPHSEEPYVLLRGEEDGRLRRCFAELISVWASRRAGCEMRAVGHLYELISLFYLSLTEQGSTEMYQRLLPAKEHIERYYDRPITLEELARLSNMSVTNFRREWKKQYSLPPMCYRDSIRLYYAKEYLSRGYYSVSEIAHRCGFEDVSYFVRFFKKQTGTTPGSFKKQLCGI